MNQGGTIGLDRCKKKAALRPPAGVWTTTLRCFRAPEPSLFQNTSCVKPFPESLVSLPRV